MTLKLKVSNVVDLALNLARFSLFFRSLSGDVYSVPTRVGMSREVSLKYSWGNSKEISVRNLG